MISEETRFHQRAQKIEDVRYTVFRFQVSTNQKVGGSSPSKRTRCDSFGLPTVFRKRSPKPHKIQGVTVVCNSQEFGMLNWL